jgi:hypothetical protein
MRRVSSESSYQESAQLFVFRLLEYDLPPPHNTLSAVEEIVEQASTSQRFPYGSSRTDLLQNNRDPLSSPPDIEIRSA